MNLSCRFLGKNIHKLPIKDVKPRFGDMTIDDFGRVFIFYMDEWWLYSDLFGKDSKLIKEEVLEFINNFKNSHKKEIEDVFTNGYCYWFAEILRMRFNGEIYYSQKDNHFACCISENLFDITGLIEDTHTFVLWEKYQCDEPYNSNTLYRDCILHLDSNYPIDNRSNTCNGIELKIYR